MNAVVVETHSSTLFFVDGLVYKRKKPLDLGFCDFRTREARLAACVNEVRLNRRLAPDVYLGVSDVLGRDGKPCDHLVVMRHLPDDRRLATLVTGGADVEAALREVAVQLADLHRTSPAPIALRDLARGASLQHLWDVGLDALCAFPDLVPEPVRDRTRELASRWLAGREPLLAARAETYVFDGHGDLLADDIFVMEDGPRILDCLEFDEHLRVGDGIADAAFLAMDLERLGAPTAARTFLDAYERAAGDHAPASLEDLYLAYRAHVRCKVSCIQARQHADPHVIARAGQLADLALAHLERARIRLVLVGGLPGSGKTTLAAGLATDTGWTHLSSDVMRKHLAGVDTTAHERFRSGLYAPEMTERTYGALLTEARTALSLGRSVVLDASWVDQQWRARARALAEEVYADLVELECVVAADVAEARILRRVSTSSDATPAIRRQLGAVADPWPEAVTVDTQGSPASTQATVLGLAGWHPSDRLLSVRRS